MLLSELRKSRHLSATSIGTYIDCPRRYSFAYIEKLPMEYVADALKFGATIHRVLGEFYLKKMVGNKMSLKDVHQSFEIHWRDTAEGRADIRYAKGVDYEKLLKTGIDLLSAWYHKLPEDNFKVLTVEETFSFEIPDLSVPIIGAIDLIEEDKSGTIIITDFKTSARAYSADEIDKNIQMTIYQLAAKANGFGDREILLKLDCLIKTLKPKFEQYYTVRSEIDEIRLLKKIHQVWASILKKAFVPNDTSWKCKSCPYRKACDEWFLTGR